MKTEEELIIIHKTL